MNGKILKIYQDKNYGFLQAPEEKDDRFFHKGDCATPAEFVDLEEGDQVSFEPAEGPKGPRANAVRLYAKDGDVQPDLSGPDGFR